MTDPNGYTPAPMRYALRHLRTGLLALLLTCPWTTPVAAQDLNRDGFSIGLGFAGTGLLSLLMEYRWGNAAMEVSLSTISFTDVGLYAGGRAYLGGATPQPVLGLGLWGLLAGSEDRTGGALILRAPIGIDWNVSGASHLGFNIALNKALVVRRPDPADTEPPNPRLVPLPGIEYRYRTN